MKFLTTLFALLLAMQLNAAAPLSTRMNRYIDKVEANCDNWTKEQWAASAQEYAKFIEEYRSNRDSYTSDEKYLVNKEIGRYNGLLVKYGATEAGNYLKRVAERVPPLLEGFVGSIRN